MVCGTQSASGTAAPPVPESYDMVAPAMSLELHERGNRAVCNGQAGQLVGESAVAGAHKHQGSRQSPRRSLIEWPSNRRCSRGIEAGGGRIKG